MKPNRKTIAAAAIALAVLAGTGATTLGSLHRNASYDGDGITYTPRVAFSGHRPTGSSWTRHVASVKMRVNVRAAAKWHGGMSGTHELELDCPALLTLEDGETWKRTAVANSAESDFTLHLNVRDQRYLEGLHSYAWRCWLRVLLRADADDDPVRHVLLPVDVEYRHSV